MATNAVVIFVLAIAALFVLLIAADIVLLLGLRARIPQGGSATSEQGTTHA
ncbi:MULTISPECIES: hypothetical protein [unclassified Rhodococcus (in: high G+C Gram-positive bacteria)]|uniref:hypothetical protein n=1 Tax=Rhodococcus sp. SJ-3 TaxID=3454628 RepID=UPI003F799824